MNGLKFIRTRCNYSQAALAEQLNVSRQAVNMWENSKKNLSDSRKKELRDFFGLDNDDWFEEIDESIAKEIEKLPLYRIHDETSEHFHFSPQKESMKLYFSGNSENIVSLDEKCTLKRHELKMLSDEILEYSESRGVKNSYARLNIMNIVHRTLSGICDALKSIDDKKSIEKMVYAHTLFAVIDSINIAFGNINADDIGDTNRLLSNTNELYDYSEFAEKLSEFISEHIDYYKDKVISRSGNH